MKAVTNITLDHIKAARLVLGHLAELGHRDIAVIRGQPLSVRLGRAVGGHRRCGSRTGNPVAARIDLSNCLATILRRKWAIETTKELLARKVPFTALFAYNDISAVGAIRAIKETGLRVPEDISVVGFDDIREAAYHLPSLTTVRQPLRKIGAMAAETLHRSHRRAQRARGGILVEPELVVRESTDQPQLPKPQALGSAPRPVSFLRRQ